MPLLYYWKRDNYRRDIDFGASYHLNQSSPRLHEIEAGDSLWAFTQARRNGPYALAAELVVQDKTRNRKGFRYGSYRVWGDMARSRYFQVEEQPDVEQVIRSLSIRARARSLGVSFQGQNAVRSITDADHQLLTATARELLPEQRARLLPEEKLEAAVILGDREAVYQLVEGHASHLVEERRRYLYEEAPTRNRRLVQELQDLYEGRCQLCGWNPRAQYGKDLCHGHHIQWLSQGGDDSLDNLVLVCPNHHAIIHGLKAKFEFEDCTFKFQGDRQPLQLNTHLG